MLNRLISSVFKTYLNVKVEYHAGGFFVRKKAVYIVFRKANEVIVFTREEGLHPHDENYKLLFNGNELVLKGDEIVFEKIESEDGSNLLKIFAGEQMLFCMPSNFVDNVTSTLLTEIVVDKFFEKPYIFNLVHRLG